MSLYKPEYVNVSSIVFHKLFVTRKLTRVVFAVNRTMIQNALQCTIFSGHVTEACFANTIKALRAILIGGFYFLRSCSCVFCCSAMYHRDIKPSDKRTIRHSTEYDPASACMKEWAELCRTPQHSTSHPQPKAHTNIVHTHTTHTRAKHTHTKPPSTSPIHTVTHRRRTLLHTDRTERI